MVLIWHRWGILAVPIFVVALLLTQVAVDANWGSGYYTANFWPKATASAVAAISIGLVGWLMNRKHETWATKHRFFFLPMEYWAGIVLFITACISYGHFKGVS
ncbi:MAG: hypothetical protein KJ999_01270 [Gammaproteobacteria bacterium]|nr:hypothetical protein [Gammaproteobacteria bacterium]